MSSLFLSISIIIASETMRTILQDIFAAGSVFFADNFTVVIVSILCIAAICPLLPSLSTPRSYPGDARPESSRLPKWSESNKRSEKEVQSALSHRPAIGKESHKFERKGSALTGEPAGRQIWVAMTKHLQGEFDGISKAAADSYSAAVNPNAGDKLFRKWQQERSPFPRPGESAPALSSEEAAKKAVNFYQTLQTDDGFWAGDYGGPMFLMPGLIVSCYVCGVDLGEERRAGMVFYLRNHQQADGGWATHIEGASTMFGTVLNYVAMRLLGVPASDPDASKARAFILNNGGAYMAPSWAKFWLALLNVYDWKGINSIPPELWTFPYAFPFHPGRLWCHCRMVYLPMSYLFGIRFTAELTPLTKELRRELYDEDYESIDWNAARTVSVSHLDRYSDLSLPMRVLHEILAVYERFPIAAIRNAGLKFAMEYIHAEDDQTNYVDIGPVNKVLNMVCVYAENKDSEAFKRHISRLDDYLWVAEDGMKMQGYNGSQLWDTAFAVQAISATGFSNSFKECLRRAHHFIDITQIRDDVPNKERYFRHASKGGWPFSTNAHGWPISDCTAEGLKAILLLQENNFINQPISCTRMEDSVDLMLSFQNDDGGWATYENTRGWRWFETLNPSEVFGDIMIDYSYVECSTACITALKAFADKYPDYRSDDIRKSIARGIKFIKSIQREDGSWYGSWGCCFTYGTWFGVEGLVVGGESTSSPAVRKACEFLASKQREDGGWGESYLSCVDKRYTENTREGSQVVQTSWALLALMKGKYDDKSAIDRGIQFLVSRQKRDGDWSQESISGVFNRNCGITYTSYRNIFPIWALGSYINYEK